MRALVVGCVVVFVSASALAGAPCLPRSDGKAVTPDLGIVAGTPIVCASGVCWDVDVKTGALQPRPGMTVPPGHATQAPLDAAGCAAGYCTGFKPDPDEDSPSAHVVTSTDGAHVGVIPMGQDAHPLYIFDAKTKKLVRAIPLADEKAPGNTSISNMVADAYYLGNTVYVVGTDAGPYEAVWAFRDDGTRLGLVGGGDGGFSIYAGSFDIADDSHVILTDGWMENVLVVSAKDGSTSAIARAVKPAPCKPDDFDPGVDHHTKACTRKLAKDYDPYAEAKLVSLPDGTFLAALSARRAGELAILDPKKLTVKKRLHPKVCR